MFNLKIYPHGISVVVPGNQSLLEALQHTGIDIVSPCGGKGLCGKCLVHTGTHSSGATAGSLACQTKIDKDLEVDIPAGSLFASQHFSIANTLEFSKILSGQAAEINSSGEPRTGIAIDLGTSRIAGYLIDMHTGITLSSVAMVNAQVSFGNDVITRLGFIKAGRENELLLRNKTSETLNNLIFQLCHAANIIEPSQISEFVIVGNTAMHHILINADITGLLATPFRPSVNSEIIIEARNLGITASPEALVYLPPPVAGFIGSDHLAVLLATGVFESTGPVLIMDIGTNTEMSLVNGTRITSTSCASGGAFEGSHISCGVQAITGAIDHVVLHGNTIRYHTIDDAKPIGICGSGIFDLMAQLLLNNIVDNNGRICADDYRVRQGRSGREFLLTDDLSDGGMPVSITQDDVRALQLAKAAISTGITVLLSDAGISSANLEKVIIAGSFGAYLDISSAVAIGLLPDIPPERFHQVGNAAGIGAKSLLLSIEARRFMNRIRETIRHIELVKVPDFRKIYLSALSFGR
jgi:uncharacterized 2Fe-2S/4Fe-4S cluster protein (DUF4445 family)